MKKKKENGGTEPARKAKEDKVVVRDPWRPPMYKTPEEMKDKVDSYFSNPPTKVLTKNGESTEMPFVSITGLALHLGFASRQSMYDYEEKPDFAYIIKRARTLIESEYEFMLQNGNTTGAIFALKQFQWSDKVETDNVQDIVINIDHQALGINNGS